MKKLKIFRQEVLTIANKIIISKDSFIQIRNITRIWHGRPEVDIPIFNIIISLAIGIAILQTPFSILGWLINFGTLLVIAYYIYTLCNYTLNFELSSGQVYAFTSLDHEFIKDSYEKIKDLIDNKEQQDGKYEINFNSCKIDVIKGDNNKVVNADNVLMNEGDNNTFNVNQTDDSKKQIVDSFNTTTKINYEVIAKELSVLLTLQDIQSQANDVQLIHDAQKKADAKDKEGLKATLKKLSQSTLNIIDRTASLLTIATFLKDVL